MSKLYNLLSAMCGKIKKPDWNQNDSTAADYVKNRPFYETDDGEVVKIDAKYLPESSGGGFTIVAIDVDPTTYNLTCALTFDEVYNLISKKLVCFEIYAGEELMTIGRYTICYTHNDVRRVGYTLNYGGHIDENYFTEDGKWVKVYNLSGFGVVTETDTGLTITWGATK